ncbi:MAG: DUF929 family protein [Candidatus Micrarchaeaceae archaeon]
MPEQVRMLDYAVITVIVLLAIVIAFQSFEINGISSKLSSDYLSLSSQIKAASIVNPPNQSNIPNESFGSRLTNIDQPLNASELSIINNAPNSYFEEAAQKLLDGNLTDQVILNTYNNSVHVGPYMLDGKPTVIYIGAISCVFCGENRWAMALALSRFGNFTTLYKGYSSFGDHDLPTLYWADDNYTVPEGVGFGNSYHSNYINFISADYLSPIVQGFEVQPLSYFISKAPNSTYKNALIFMNATKQFQGTPFTLWGNTLITGADAVVFGNSTPTSATLPLTYETHSQVLSQLKNFNDQFAWGEYAAADVYIAYTCPYINDTATVCQLPAIKQLISYVGA